VFLKKHKYDILALLETHTFASDMDWLKNAFPGYSIMCEGENKTKALIAYRENKLKYINTLDISEKEKESLIMNINENLYQTSGGVVLLIQKELVKNFTRRFVIPQNRGISIGTKYHKENLNLHFVYAPPQADLKESFWYEFKKNLIAHQSHIIIGDLNVHIGAEDSASGTSNTPSSFDELCHNFSLIDT